MTASTAAHPGPDPPQGRRSRVKSILTNGWLIAFVTGLLFLGLSSLLSRLGKDKPSLTCHTEEQTFGSRLSTIRLGLSNSGDRHLSDVEGDFTFSEKVSAFGSPLFDRPGASVVQSSQSDILSFTVPELDVGDGGDVLILFDRPAKVASRRLCAVHFYDRRGRQMNETIDARFLDADARPNRGIGSRSVIAGALSLSAVLVIVLLSMVIRRRRSNANT
jgi:hypothetical protein